MENQRPLILISNDDGIIAKGISELIKFLLAALHIGKDGAQMQQYGNEPEYYKRYVGGADVKIIFNKTFPLLRQAEAALVTSGTATLETALFRVPQAVCYHTPIGKVIAFLKRHVLKVKYISLVNLIANREVVKELVADTMTVEQVRSELNRILYDKEYRRQMLEGYEYMASRLGEAGAPKHAARKMVALLRRSREE